ncbi:MAG: hypothetical protein K2Q18_08750, partial [Bdellovibrionales bacterium]|nr:hypothetical protein [Bdellovibrionales bacterium]
LGSDQIESSKELKNFLEKANDISSVVCGETSVSEVLDLLRKNYTEKDADDFQRNVNSTYRLTKTCAPIDCRLAFTEEACTVMGIKSISKESIDCPKSKGNDRALCDQSKSNVKWVPNYLSDLALVAKLGQMSTMSSQCCDLSYCGSKLNSIKNDKRNPDARKKQTSAK